MDLSSTFSVFQNRGVLLQIFAVLLYGSLLNQYSLLPSMPEKTRQERRTLNPHLTFALPETYIHTPWPCELQFLQPKHLCTSKRQKPHCSVYNPATMMGRQGHGRISPIRARHTKEPPLFARRTLSVLYPLAMQSHLEMLLEVLNHAGRKRRVHLARAIVAANAREVHDFAALWRLGAGSGRLGRSHDSIRRVGNQIRLHERCEIRLGVAAS